MRSHTDDGDSLSQTNDTLTDIKLDTISQNGEPVYEEEVNVATKPITTTDNVDDSRFLILSFIVTMLTCSSLGLAVFFEASKQIKGRMLPPEHFGTNYYGAIFFPLLSIVLTLSILFYCIHYFLRLPLNSDSQLPRNFSKTTRILAVII